MDLTLIYTMHKGCGAAVTAEVQWRQFKLKAFLSNVVLSADMLADYEETVANILSDEFVLDLQYVERVA